MHMDYVPYFILYYVVIGSSAMLNGHCNDPEEYDRISCSAASETQVIHLT